MLAPGTRVGRYVVISRLGAGAMGVVYRARDDANNCDVAVKVLSQERASNRKAVARFLREAHAIAVLNHPSIVAFHEVGETESGHFLAMELVEGRPLRASVGRRPPLREFVGAARQLAQALAATHALGIAHRDLKPENVLLLSDGSLRLLDFGLARLASPEEPLRALQLAEVTTLGTVIGTVRYMSPEQARGERVTTATDLFSLGLILFEWATGRHPFASDFPMEVLRGILSDAPPDSRRWRPDLAPELHLLLHRLLEKDPAQRPTANEADLALGAILDLPAAVVVPNPADAPIRVPASTTSPATPAAAGVPRPKPPGRRRKWWPW